MKPWRKRRGSKFLTEDVNGRDDEGGTDDAEPEKTDVRSGVYGNGDWVGSVVEIIFNCPSEAEQAEDAVDIVL